MLIFHIYLYIVIVGVFLKHFRTSQSIIKQNLMKILICWTLSALTCEFVIVATLATAHKFLKQFIWPYSMIGKQNQAMIPQISHFIDDF